MPIDHNFLKKAPREFTRFSSCISSVRLSNVRRIGLSIGESSRTRGSEHVSGLCFEFWDSNVPVYVGQWFHEARHLDIEQGERITRFTFWQAQGRNEDTYLRENTGKITGVRIEKAGIDPKELQYYLGHESEMLTYSFAENPYEELVRIICMNMLLGGGLIVI